MPRIRFDKVRKSFGDNIVIPEFTADIPDKEFLVILGPSGCGKSTLLRILAGLTDISAGELLFDDDVVNSMEPRERNVAFVFQSYALYPHMTVRDNIAFPLIMDRFRLWHHIPIVNVIARRSIARSPEVRERVGTVAAMLELENYLGRRPKTLSGGQRQRVAVARALVRDPSIYLMDEPLSNLDAQLRTQMRAEIAALYKRVNKSFVYVTHDQVEAMTMATRIIVLNVGEVQQIGTPDEIYNNPANAFVARFIGSPGMNLIPARVTSGSAAVRENSDIIDPSIGNLPDGDYLAGIRPEKLSLAETSGQGIRGHIVAVEHSGGESLVGFRFHEARNDKLLSSSALQATHYAKIARSAPLPIGSEQWFTFDTSSLNWFYEDTGLAVRAAASENAVTDAQPVVRG